MGCKRLRSRTAATAVMMALLLTVYAGRGAEGLEQPVRRPTPEEIKAAMGLRHDIIRLYGEDKPQEARATLLKYAEECKAISAREIESGGDAEALLGGIEASAVLGVMKLERDWNPGAKMPDEVYQAADIVRKTTDDCLAAYEKLPADIKAQVKRPERMKAYSVRAKRELLELEIAELKRDGREEQVQEILAEEAPFLERHKIKAEDVLSAAAERLAPPKPPPPSVKMSGRDLAVLQLLLAYYAALSAKDAAALDRILQPGEKMMTGKEILAAFAADVAATQGYDSLGSVILDDGSNLRVEEKGADELQVTLARAVKAYRREGIVVATKRESDQFTVRKTEDKYKLVFTRSGKQE